MDIILHLGAHKTGTTSLQMRLTRSADLLQERGVFIVKNGELRGAIKQVSGNSSLINKIRGVRLWRASGVYRRYLKEAQSAKCNRIVISEEMLLGAIEPLINSGHFYQSIANRLQPVLKGFNGQPVTVLLALRSYDSFLASACSEFIRQQGYRCIDASLKARLFSLRRGWIEVIEDILKSLPANSLLRVWRFEDFCKDDQGVLRELVGSENISQIEHLAWRASPRLSEQAIRQLEKLSKAGEPTTPEVVRSLEKRFSKEKGFKAYSPWSDEEQAILARRYDDDVARIRALWPSAMI